MIGDTEYEKAKTKFVDQDYGFSTLTAEIRPLNVLNKISDKVKSYGKKELDNL